MEKRSDVLSEYSDNRVLLVLKDDISVFTVFILVTSATKVVHEPIESPK